MKGFLLSIALVFGSVALARAWNPPDGSFSFDSDTRSILISTTATIPTLLCTKDSYVQRTWIINPSSYTIYISSVAVGISTNSFGIPGTGAAANSPIIFTLDGVNSPWWGQLYGYASTNNAPAPVISIFRTK